MVFGRTGRLLVLTAAALGAASLVPLAQSRAADKTLTSAYDALFEATVASRVVEIATARGDMPRAAEAEEDGMAALQRAEAIHETFKARHEVALAAARQAEIRLAAAIERRRAVQAAWLRLRPPMSGHRTIIAASTGTTGGTTTPPALVRAHAAERAALAEVGADRAALIEAAVALQHVTAVLAELHATMRQPRATPADVAPANSTGRTVWRHRMRYDELLDTLFGPQAQGG